MGSLEQNGPSAQVFLQMWPSVRGEGLPSLSLPGLLQCSPGWRQKRGLGGKISILCAIGTRASGSLCDPFPTLDQLQGESFYWNVARPELSSGKRQAGSLLYTVTHFKGGGVPMVQACIHTGTHRLSRAKRPRAGCSSWWYHKKSWHFFTPVLIN